jgi:hypothetical protein
MVILGNTLEKVQNDQVLPLDINQLLYHLLLLLPLLHLRLRPRDLHEDRLIHHLVAPILPIPLGPPVLHHHHHHLLLPQPRGMYQSMVTLSFLEARARSINL